MDFSCADSRQELSWSKVLRQIGTTLSNPISTMMKELQVFHHYIYLREGCPSPENVKMLTTITKGIDALQTQIITALPGSNLYMMLQLLIGPTLKMFADELDNKKINSQELMGFNQQGAAMIRQLVPTLSQSELSKLYPEKNPESKYIMQLDDDLLNKRFKLKDGDIHIDIDGNDSRIQANWHNIPVAVSENSVQRVYFDSEMRGWKFSGVIPGGESFQHRKIKEFGTSINEFSDSKIISMKVSKDDSKYFDMVVNDHASKAVYIQGHFIPVEKIVIGSDSKELVTVAVLKTKPNKSILLWSNQGWIFEPETAKMDNDVEAFLETDKNGVTYDSRNVFSQVKSNGLSYDRAGTPHLKYDDRYF